MKKYLLWKRFLIGCLILVPLYGFVTAQREKPTLELTFYGDSCSYQGPTLFKAGPVTLRFFNESEGLAAVNLVRHTGDETIQDMMDTFVEEPSTAHHPAWTAEIKGVWKVIDAGESHTWEGALEPGIHTMVCARIKPFGVWFGTGLTVED